MAFKSNDKTFEKVYGIFDKRDYFNAKGLAKVQIGNFERALQRNDKGAQQILDKFKGDMDKAKDYIIQVITDRKKEEAFNQYKAFKAAVDSIQKGKPIYGAVDLVKSRIHNSSQKYTIALYSALRNKKFTKWKDVHNDIDSLVNESVNEQSINELNPRLNKKVKSYLDAYLKGEKKNSPEHQHAIMLIMKGALTDANFHSEAKKLDKLFPKAKQSKYVGTKMEDVIEDKGIDIASWAKWDGHDIIDAFAFYTNMNIGGGFGNKLTALKESVTETINERLNTRDMKYMDGLALRKPLDTALKELRKVGQDLIDSEGFDKGDVKEFLLSKVSRVLHVGLNESVNEAMKPSQVRSAISKVKKGLMRKWKQKGGYENFGQKELSQMKDKFDYNPYGSSDERQISKMLDGFDNWAMNYDGNMREDKAEVEQIAKKTKSETAFYDVLSKIEKKYGKRNYRMWLEKSLKDLGVNSKHYDYRTNAAAEEKLYQLTK